VETVTQGEEQEAKAKTFEINHDGDLKSFVYLAEETVSAVIVEAIHRFRLAAQPHQLGLFKAGAADPLDPNKTLRKAGVRPDEILILRPIVVQGG